MQNVEHIVEICSLLENISYIFRSLIMQGTIHNKQHLEFDSLLHREPIYLFQHRSDVVKFLCARQQPGSRIMCTLQFCDTWLSHAIHESIKTNPSRHFNWHSWPLASHTIYRHDMRGTGHWWRCKLLFIWRSQIVKINVPPTAHIEQMAE